MSGRAKQPPLKRGEINHAANERMVGEKIQYVQKMLQEINDMSATIEATDELTHHIQQLYIIVTRNGIHIHKPLPGATVVQEYPKVALAMEERMKEFTALYQNIKGVITLLQQKASAAESSDASFVAAPDELVEIVSPKHLFAVSRAVPKMMSAVLNVIDSSEEDARTELRRKALEDHNAAMQMLNERLNDESPDFDAIADGMKIASDKFFSSCVGTTYDSAISEY